MRVDKDSKISGACKVWAFLTCLIHCGVAMALFHSPFTLGSGLLERLLPGALLGSRREKRTRWNDTVALKASA